jgi:hypothetical protein
MQAACVCRLECRLVGGHIAGAASSLRFVDQQYVPDSCPQDLAYSFYVGMLACAAAKSNRQESAIAQLKLAGLLPHLEDLGLLFCFPVALCAANSLPAAVRDRETYFVMPDALPLLVPVAFLVRRGS